MLINRITPNCAYDLGVMVEVHYQGCGRACSGCYAKNLWSSNVKDGKVMYWADVLLAYYDYKDVSDGLVLTGGDPLYQVIETFNLALRFKELHPGKELWLYTGFSKEEIDQSVDMKQVFNLCDVVITDPYVQELRQKGLIGSSNQRMWKNGVLVK